jgi:hypothetical protein
VRAALASAEQPRVVVLLERLDRAALAALAYARTISPEVTAVHIADGVETARLRSRWSTRAAKGIGLDVILSDGAPADRVAAYLDEHAPSDGTPTVVVIPTIAPRARWLYPLVNWSALRLARRLRGRPGTAVVAAPYAI